MCTGHIYLKPQYGGPSSSHFVVIASQMRSGSSSMTYGLARHRCVHNFNELFSGFDRKQSKDAAQCVTAEGFSPLGSYLSALWTTWDAEVQRIHPKAYGMIPSPVTTLEQLHDIACKGLDQIYAARGEPLCGSRCAITFKLFPDHLPWSTTKRILRDNRTALVILDRDPAASECSLTHAERNNDWGINPNNHSMHFDRSKCPKQATRAYLHAHRKWYSLLLSMTQYRPGLYLRSADFFENEGWHLHRVLRKAGMRPRRLDMCPPGTFSPPVVCGLTKVSLDEVSCANHSHVTY